MRFSYRLRLFSFRTDWALIAFVIFCACLILFSVLAPNIPRPRFLDDWAAPQPKWSAWKPIFQGIELCKGNFISPRPLKAYALRIDLTHPGITPVLHAPMDSACCQVQSICASDFLIEQNLQVAISTGSFVPFPLFSGVPVQLVNLSIADGRMFVPPTFNLDALILFPEGKAQLLHHGTPLPPKVQNAVGGMWITLNKYINVAEDLEQDAASVCGISGNGRFLLWLIVDGRQSDYSEGVTVRESAEMMRELGASDALNMDGGSVVTLVIENERKSFSLLNKPCHPIIHGLQRPIGGLMGFRARPL